MAYWQYRLLAKCMALGSVVLMCTISSTAMAFAKKSVGATFEQTHLQTVFFSKPAKLQGSAAFLPEPRFDASRLQYARAGLTLSDAIATAKRRHGGEVLSARRAQDASGRTIYVIKILTKRGVVKKVTVRE